MSNTNDLATINTDESYMIDVVSGCTEGNTVRICHRPEDVAITPDNDPTRKNSAQNCFAGKITRITPFGAMVRLKINCGFPLMVLITKRSANVTTQVPKTTIRGLRYAGTIRDVVNTITKPGI
ncbi:MAG: hypothetical protein EF813_03695 [Methanosarcinales archaeon]|nr:MAG: hypothetical protein EF813_03695 [Methanosarcinales archaeon]